MAIDDARALDGTRLAGLDCSESTLAAGRQDLSSKDQTAAPLRPFDGIMFVLFQDERGAGAPSSVSRDCNRPGRRRSNRR
jgi:hypothetical protein